MVCIISVTSVLCGEIKPQDTEVTEIIRDFFIFGGVSKAHV